MPKKPKLSKAEQERLKREEEERRAAEEEALRLQQEKEEEERRERERQEKEEREKELAIEKERFSAETKDLEEITKKHEENLVTVRAEDKVQAKWDRYMCCDGSPDPSIEKELNAYVSLWSEDDVAQKEIGSILNECEQTRKVAGELKCLLTHDDELGEKDRNRHRKSITMLEKMLDERLDLATLHLLQFADSHVNEDSGNLEVEANTDNICFCLWGNVAKNPRIKSFEFQSCSFTFEMPKQLLLANVAIRLMITQYDHFSPRCRLFCLDARNKQKITNFENQQEAETVQEESKNKDENEDGAVSSSDVAESSDDRQITTEGEAEMTEDSNYGGSTATNMAKTEVENTTDGGIEVDQQAEGKNEQQTEASGGDDGVADGESSDDELLDDEDVVDLRQFRALGGIFHFDLLELPPQPKTVNNWTIRQITKPELAYQPYPADSTGRNTAASGKKNEPSASASWAPLAVTIKLPQNVFLPEEPQVGRWEPSQTCWRLDGIRDTTVDVENRTISFKTLYFCPLALFVDQYVHMPYESWEMRPLTDHSVVVTLTTASRIDIEIQVKNTECCLTKPKDLNEVRHIQGKWLKFDDLREALIKAGVNIFPSDDGDKYVKVPSKVRSLEMSTYHLMSILCPSVAFGLSRWNAERGQDQIVMRACEVLSGKPVRDEDWKTFLCSVRCAELKVDEDSDEFSDEFVEKAETHPDIFNVFKPSASHEALERIQNASSEFVECVHNLLKCTRLIVYS